MEQQADWYPTRSTRKRMASCILIFCGLVVTYVVFMGDPESRIHEDAMYYSFWLAGTVLVGYVIGANVDNWKSLGVKNGGTKP
jgi:hypothetical protein